jgi:hypothetical protein
MTLRVADTLEVRRWILGYGTDAEVVEQEAESLARLLMPGRRPLAAVAPAPRPERRGRARAARAKGAVE